jgi:hypothetical protein
VSRDGDPSPAVAAVIATGLGPAVTTALAAIVDGRLHAAGFDAEVHVDRDAFRVELQLADAGRAPALFAAFTAAMSRPLAAGSAELALAGRRLASLGRNPLDAPELTAIAACTGALGVAPGERLPDLGGEAAIRELDASRRAALHTGNVAIAAVGPASFGPQIERALERSDGWPAAPVAASADPWPSADVTGVYVSPSLDRRSARITIAVRVADPELAASAAERLGAPDSPLVARLRLLPEPWRVVQVAGVARARGGGCASVVLETGQHAPGQPIEPGAALAAAVARREIAAELAAGGGAVAGRQILTATDTRDAAARAAWWALASSSPGVGPRWAEALGVPAAGERGREPPPPVAAGRFQAELARAVAAGAAPAAERRVSVERGQGELWVLLASPCGVAEEGALDAGFGALAALAAIEARRRVEGVTLEPWITSDGTGLIAHAALRDDGESSVDLARRVAGAAARALTATAPTAEALAAARAALLDHLERTAGHQGAAFAVFAPAMSPDHPSWLEPAGVWARVAGAGLEAVRLRGQALASGPLRVAVLANADAAQAAAAADAVDRWLSPTAAPRACHPGAAASPRPGRYEARMPADAPLAQALIGVPVPAPGAPGRDLAELSAAALDGSGGLLATALAQAAATASARLAGGSRSPSLILDVRAPVEVLAAAVAEVRALLARLPTAATEADLVRAAAAASRREHDARADPRRRLGDLWAGRHPGAAPRATLAAWRAFLGATLRDAAEIVVEAKPE